jgi:hypothetical protein
MGQVISKHKALNSIPNTEKRKRTNDFKDRSLEVIQCEKQKETIQKQ